MITNTSSVKLVESCGKFHHIAKPGCEFLMPCVQAVSGTISMKLQMMEVRCETKSKDNVFLTMSISIQYQVIDEPSKIIDAHYRLTNPRVQVRTHTRAAAGEGGREPATLPTAPLVVRSHLVRRLTNPVLIDHLFDLEVEGKGVR